MFSGGQASVAELSLWLPYFPTMIPSKHALQEGFEKSVHWMLMPSLHRV